MKKQVIPFILVLLALICFSIAFTSCVATTSYTAPVSEWRIQENARLRAVTAHVTSPEHMRQYSGTSISNNIPGAVAPSIVGTTADPFKDIRTLNLTPTTNTYRVNVQTGSSFTPSTTQNYDIRVIK